MRLLLVRAEVDGHLVDVRLRDGRVHVVDTRLRPAPDEDVVDAGGGALLPGLHDHHLHLLALAAAAASVDCGPPAVQDLAGLADALAHGAAACRPGEWVRGVGYADAVAGPLDRDVLDRLVRHRPTRVQHRGGALWVLNSAGLELLDLTDEADPDVERDLAGRATGRLWRFDARLRRRLGTRPPDLAAVGTRLSCLGITGVTDATPDLDQAAVDLLGAAAERGELPQAVLLLGADGDAPLPAGFTRGPRKMLLRDHDLPHLDDLVEAIARTHAAGRAVAVHCVTRESLVLTLTALEAAGPHRGDRVEHAAVVPPELRARLGRAAAVVTQPCFVRDRGDDYLRDVHPEDLPHLYPYASLLAAGARVVPSSDAPFGDVDPWRTLSAAASRRTTSGATLGPNERVPAATALAGMLAPLAAPGGPPRRVTPGAEADLCLLGVPLDAALAAPSADHVRLVLRGGRALFGG